MGEKYLVKWSFESIYDVADIADYIEMTFGQNRAEQFNDDIDEEIGSLCDMPSKYPDIGMYYRGFLIRKMVTSPSLVFYAVDETESMIYILRVLREERDWHYILNKQNNYKF